MTKSLPAKALQEVAQHGPAGKALWNDNPKASALLLLPLHRFLAAVAKLETSLMQAQGTGHHGCELFRSMQPVLGAEAPFGFRLPGHGGRPTRA